MKLSRLVIVFLCLPTSISAQTILTPEKPFVTESVGKGETRTYTFPLQTPSDRYTVTLQPITGDPDLKVWLSANTNQPPSAQSLQGPLLTDRVSFSPKDLAGTSLFTIEVVGTAAAQYTLSVMPTPFHTDVSAPRRKAGALKVVATDLFGDGNHLISDVEISNQSTTWYEVSVGGNGESYAKSLTSDRFVLGPRQTRKFPWLAFTPGSSLEIRSGRTSKAALIYLACDITARLVNGGAGLPGTFAEDVQSLLPQLQPLSEVGTLFARRKAVPGIMKLIAIVRKDPKTFAALHQFLKHSGIGVSQSVLTGRILSGFGPISAIIQGVKILESPERETAEVQALPNTQ